MCCAGGRVRGEVLGRCSEGGGMRRKDVLCRRKVEG